MERQKVNLRGDYSKYSVLNELSFRGLFFPLASTIVNGGSRNFDLGTYGYSNGVKGDDCSFFFYNKSTSDSATINVYCTNQSNVNIYKFEPLYMSDDVTENKQ